MKPTGHTVPGASKVASEETLRVEDDKEVPRFGSGTSGAKRAGQSEFVVLDLCPGELIQIEIFYLFKRYHLWVPGSGLFYKRPGMQHTTDQNIAVI
jgi:hypothetical protein